MTNYNNVCARSAEEYLENPDEFIEDCVELFSNGELTLKELELIVGKMPLENPDLNDMYKFMNQNEEIYRGFDINEATRYREAKIIIRNKINLNNGGT